MTTINRSPEFRLIDFKITSAVNVGGNRAIKEFVVQAFGINEKGESASINVKGFQPFFFVKVGEKWDHNMLKMFENDIYKKLAYEELEKNYKKWQLGQRKTLVPPPLKEESKAQYAERNCRSYQSYYEKGIASFTLVKKHKLYGFDNHKLHNFACIKFKNISSYNKIKNFWFDRIKDGTSVFGYRQVLKHYVFKGVATQIYEAKLPPLLRFFHVHNISPSGWICLPSRKWKSSRHKKTLCDYEFSIHARDIAPLPNKESAVPIKICSFDIEASSSHGDFPVAIKSYKKLAGELQTHWTKYLDDITKLRRAEKLNLLKNQILTAFGFADVPSDGISVVYPKSRQEGESPIDLSEVLDLFDGIAHTGIKNAIGRNKVDPTKRSRDIHDDDEIYTSRKTWNPSVKKRNNDGNTYTVLDCLLDNIDSSKKVDIIDKFLTLYLPPLEGDKVTFIGSTFMLAGEDTPYLNHGICLDTCTDYGDSDIEIVPCETERQVLLEWTKVIQRERPDVIIGYNIFGFDYKFMCNRAMENGCFDDFCQLGKNRGVKCERMDKEIKIASGTHELTYLKIDGVIQIDLYNYFRREVNLGSYKLQDVASHFIGDMVSETIHNDGYTVIKSRNLMGLQEDNFIIFEIIGHSLDPYNEGKKYKVRNIDQQKGEFIVDGEITIPSGKKLRWGLGKDDVSPQDLFRLTNGTADDRQIIAKYCFQDCNLVHHLLRKNDVLTGMTEIASICSIPIDFVVMRGQGIKLLSFIAKKCGEKDTLMPVIEKAENDGSYEGAICLPPKKGLYSDDPVWVGDYASLYPSSMISENISHDSKVWTKEYDLKGKLLKVTGSDEYDNLPDTKYVDIEYDRYEWRAPEGRKKEEKIKIGTKVCRYVQFEDGKKAIMPSILRELLAARKATRTLIKYKTLDLSDGTTISGLIKKEGDEYVISNKEGSFYIDEEDVINISDTYNDFMKNVFNQRQLGYKITANSLYGQTGARTSAFYDIDIAASTTATGRKLLLYAEAIIEKAYGDTVCDTKYGKVRCNAERIYGDTDSVFATFNLKDMDGKKITGKKALEITIELAIQACELASKFLKHPHDFEYEKTFAPFLLLSKKRYVGMLYEKNPNKGKRKSMGIVLKRRDNADVVKDIYGGNIDILMKDGNIGAAIEFTKKFLQNIVDGKIDLDKLVITKSLRGWYKNPQSIAHKVLADRMGKRDPGNKPAVGSRIPFVYFQTKQKVKLQGDKIENPTYMKKHGLVPDYPFYITNQIMKPLAQIFALVLEQIPQFKPSLARFRRQVKTLKRKWSDDPGKMEREEEKLRTAAVKKIIFDDALRLANNRKQGQRSIESFFA